MNLVELLVFVGMLSLAVAGGIVGAHLGGIWLAIPAALAGGFLIPSLVYAHLRYQKWVYPGLDDGMPLCGCGEHLKFDFREMQYGCEKCGKRYHRKHDTIWILEGDEKRIFKQLVKYKGWM